MADDKKQAMKHLKELWNKARKAIVKSEKALSAKELEEIKYSMVKNLGISPEEFDANEKARQEKFEADADQEKPSDEAIRLIEELVAAENQYCENHCKKSLWRNEKQCGKNHIGVSGKMKKLKGKVYGINTGEYETLLHVALEKRRLDVATKLLELGANPNIHYKSDFCHLLPLAVLVGETPNTAEKKAEKRRKLTDSLLRIGTGQDKKRYDSLLSQARQADDVSETVSNKTLDQDTLEVALSILLVLDSVDQMSITDSYSLLSVACSHYGVPTEELDATCLTAEDLEKLQPYDEMALKLLDASSRFEVGKFHLGNAQLECGRSIYEGAVSKNLTALVERLDQISTKTDVLKHARHKLFEALSEVSTKRMENNADNMFITWMK